MGIGIARLLRLLLPGTLVYRLHRLRDRRHAQWSRRSSPSPSARTSALRSATRYLAYVPADRLLDRRCGGRLPEIRIIRSRSNLDPWILLAAYSGSADPLAAYFMHFPFCASPHMVVLYIILYWHLHFD